VDLNRHGLSSAMTEASVLLGTGHAFRGASRLLKQLTGISLDHRTIHRRLGEVGQAAAQGECDASDSAAQADLPQAELEAQTMHAAADGIMVRFRGGGGFKEVKVGLCYGVDRRDQPFCRHVARTESVESFKWHVAALTARCGLDGADKSALVSDGAAWIWDHVASVLREDTRHIVDWYHASQHVWECGKALHGEGTPETATWVESILDLLHDGQVRMILQRLGDERSATRSPAKREALSGLITYVTNQDARLAYDRFRAEGFDIGSGRVEAACKQLVAQRLKGVGMAWSPRGAQAVLSMRSHWLNRTWDDFWRRRRAA